MKSRIVAGLIAGLAISSSASATQVFFDGFETDTVRLSATTLNNFGVIGQVDVVAASNGFGITAYSGNVIDLDGTPGPGAISHSYAFAAGDKVVLSFVIGGAQRQSVSDDFNFGFTFGGATIADLATTGVFGSSFLTNADGSLFINLPGTAAYTPTTLSFTASTNGTFGFSFGTSSHDDKGPLLDSVGLEVTASAVPGPIMGAGLPGFVIALGALVALRRRRMAAA
jgi:hypothetical protein